MHRSRPSSVNARRGAAGFTTVALLAAAHLLAAPEARGQIAVGFGDAEISDANWSANFTSGDGFGYGGEFFEGDGFGYGGEFFEDDIPGDGYGGDGVPAFFSWDSWSFEGIGSGYGGDGYGFENVGQLASSTWYFRTDTDGLFDDREYNIAELGPVSFEGFEDAPVASSVDFGFSGRGLDVELRYALDGAVGGDPLRSNIASDAIVTNRTGAPVSFSVFSYADLDLDNSISGQVSQLFSANTLRQTSLLGTRVDIRSTGDLNPTGFSNDAFSDLEDQLLDGDVTDLDNNPSFGPGDATNAFQWDFTLDAGEQTTLALLYEGTFSEVGQGLVFPDEIVDNGDGTSTFFFNDGSPPIVGENPRVYDPEIAVGYEYAIDGGDNAFAELALSDLFPGEDGSLLEILDAAHDLNGQLIPIGPGGPGITYSFVDTDAQGDGASAFRITGIDPALMLDPEDALAFPTGLTFVNGSAVSFTQTSIVPEPASAALALIGSALLLRRRR